jgi:stress response protein YsnF
MVREPVVEAAAAPGDPAAETAPLPAGAVTASELPQSPGEVTEGVAAEVVLYEERPVVGVEVVPRERIRLVKTFETDEVVVADRVRHEEPAVDRLPPAS